MVLSARRSEPAASSAIVLGVLLTTLLVVWPLLLAANVPDPNPLRITPVEPSKTPKASPPAIPLANVLAPHIDVSKYLVSEKYDGVRAVWDGSVLRFRSGNVVNAPRWFLAKLPATPLDGELWIARGKFDLLSGIVPKVSPG